jgi:hypothetical protein
MTGIPAVPPFTKLLRNRDQRSITAIIPTLFTNATLHCEISACRLDGILVDGNCKENVLIERLSGGTIAPLWRGPMLLYTQLGAAEYIDVQVSDLGATVKGLVMKAQVQQAHLATWKAQFCERYGAGGGGEVDEGAGMKKGLSAMRCPAFRRLRV